MTSLSRSAFALTTALAVISLGACGGGEPESEEPSGDATSVAPSESPTAEEPEPYLPVPDGVVLEPAGTDLAFGEPAVVATELRQGQAAALEVEVRSVEQVSFEVFSGLDLSEVDDTLRPYFVQTRLTNVDANDLGGRSLPLYLVDDEGTLIETTGFAEKFDPCPSEALPKRFPPDESTRACYVFLAEAAKDEATVAFRPAEDIDLITWTGELTTADDGKRGGKGKKNRSGQGKGQGNGQRGGGGNGG